MGLFSRKKITTVASVAINTVADTPNTGKDSILMSVLTDGDMSAELITNYSNGLGLKMRNLQLWADTHYTYGLPSAKVSGVRATDVRVRNIIQDETALTVEVISNIAGTVDTDSLAYQFMQEQRGWDLADNRVTLPPSGTVGAVQFQTSFIKSPGIVVIQYVDSVGIKEEEILFSGLTADDVWYHVSYREIGGDTTKYWNYEVSTNVYPELNTVGNLIQAKNPYFPIVPFRVNNVNQADNPNSDAFKTSTQLLDKLGMNFAEMAEGIHDNPDIAEVDQAFLYVAVPLTSDRMNTIRYLQAHFEDLERISPYKKRNFDIWNASEHNTAPPPVNTIKILDSTFNLDFSYTYIDTQIITADRYNLHEGVRIENVLPVGTKTTTYTSGRNDTVHERVLYSYEQSTVIFEVQVAPGEVHRTTVHGLYIENHIYGSHSVEASLATAVEDKTKFLVPVNVNVVNDMGIKDGDRLYYDALWMIFNSYKVTKLKWYQSSFFKAIITIVAIIITIYSLGSMAGAIAAAAAISTTQVVITIISQIVSTLLIKAAVDFALEKIGLVAALVLTVAASMYGVGGTAGGVASTNLLPFAQEILAVAQVMVKEFAKDVQEALGDVSDEISKLLSDQSEIEEEFERLEKELTGDSGELDYSEVVRLRPNINLTETPSEFFHRAIHAGNIGIATLDSPRNYVDTMLELPKNETIFNFDGE